MRDGESAIAERYRLLGPQLNERQRRAFAASEARRFGYGGIAAAARACGLTENTVRKGLRELDEQPLAAGRVRKPGAGRPAGEDSDPKLLEVLRKLVENDTRGDPERVLLWTAKSARRLADELAEHGHPVGFRTVPRLLRKLGYSLQSARKTLEGKQHPARDAQFRHINQKVSDAIAAGQPAISIDTRRRSSSASSRTPGANRIPRAKRRRSAPTTSPAWPTARRSPTAFTTSPRTPASYRSGSTATPRSSRSPRSRRGGSNSAQSAIPNAQSLTITADCGGSNGNRTRLWKTELQRLADHTGLQITVCHFPPGTSKWNNVEHRLFSFISRTGGRALASYEVIINSISATTTSTGLDVYARIDDNEYPTIEVTDAQLAAVNITRDAFHPQWNYTINPSTH